MPCGAELAAAADVGEDEGAASLKPQFAEDAGVDRGLGDLEAAVGAHERGVGAVVLDVCMTDDEVGDFGSIFGGGLQLLDEHVGCVELGWDGLGGLES